MKRFVITEEERRRIKLLYEQSQFVKDIAKTLGGDPSSYLPLDWSTYTSGDTQYQELSKDFTKVKDAFKTFRTNAWQNKSDLTNTINYLQNYSTGTPQQKKWKDAVVDTLQKLQTAITNANSESTTTTTTAQPQ
jgi:hypothetical protein